MFQVDPGQSSKANIDFIFINYFYSMYKISRDTRIINIFCVCAVVINHFCNLILTINCCSDYRLPESVITLFFINYVSLNPIELQSTLRNNKNIEIFPLDIKTDSLGLNNWKHGGKKQEATE